MIKEEILAKNGFDFDSFQIENEYSAKNLLLAMEEYANKKTDKEELREKFIQEWCEISVLSKKNNLIYDATINPDKLVEWFWKETK